MNKRRVQLIRGVEIAGACLGLLVLILYAEGALDDKIASGGTTNIGVTVYTDSTAAVQAMDIPTAVEAVGAIHARQETIISARIMGVIERIMVREGDYVRRGDLLVVLTAPELTAQYDASASAVQAAEAAVEQARRDYARLDYLYRREAATQVEWEKVRTGQVMAEADLARIRGAARGAGSVAAYTRIHAPVNGQVVARLLDPGSMAAPGAPIMRIESQDGYLLHAAVDERYRAAVSVGDTIAARLESLGVTLPVRVVEIVPTIDPASRTFLVKAELPALAQLRSGAFGRMLINVGTRPGLVIPAAAIRRSAGLDTVRIIAANGQAHIRRVRPGQSLANGMVEVVAGLTAGENVALEP